MVRVGLKSILSRMEDFEWVGEARQLAELPELEQALQPDVLLLDVRWPEGTSFEMCRKLKTRRPDLKVLFLTSYAEDDLVLSGIRHEGDGFLLKDIDDQELARAIRCVHEGESYLDPRITRPVFGRIRGDDPSEAIQVETPLSAQEQRVVALVAEGKTNKEIGDLMGLSDKTVKNYLSNVLEKLGYSRRSQVASYYTRLSRG